MNKYLFAKTGLGILLACTLALTGCSTTKKTTAGAAKERSAAYIMNRLDNNRLDAQFMDAKVRIDYSDDYLSMKASATIRWQKDSLLWVAVKKLGFEVARMMVTPDSIYIIDRLNNEYGVYDLRYLEETYSLPASFDLLQQLLLGNVFFFRPENVEVLIQGADYVLKEDAYARALSYQLDNRDFVLRQMAFEDKQASRSLNLFLEDYENIRGKQLFSYFRNFNIYTQETGNVQLGIKFAQVELDVPKNISFEIPRRYTRMD